MPERRGRLDHSKRKGRATRARQAMAPTVPVKPPPTIQMSNDQYRFLRNPSRVRASRPAIFFFFFFFFFFLGGGGGGPPPPPPPPPPP